jgi:mRNA-degrading endonuclease RelE of RelBE toxin-antitoxin system
MTWRVERTESFDKWWKKEKIEEANYIYHQRALEEFQPIPLPHNVQTCIFKNTSFECWVTRLPDKVRKKGKSGGFRVVFVLDLEEKVLLLQGIFRRDHLSWKGSSGKYDDGCDGLVKDLAQQFVEAKH